jgi:peptidoglycan/xylan/chitin deacetylase (PgdA/CDA1 family)
MPAHSGSSIMIKRTIRRVIAGLAPAHNRGGVRVLLYHSVDAPDPADPLALRVSREVFQKQMQFLRTEGYAVVPLAAACQKGESGDRPRVAITFDDGYQSQKWAVEVLRDLGFPATLFVVPRFLDGVQTPQQYWEAWGHLDWDDVEALGTNGIDIGAHSASHVDLTRCTAEQLEDEVAGARQILQSRLGRDIVAFSYPHGRHDARVRAAVEKAVYRVACTSRYGDNHSLQSLYAVQRTEVSGADSLVDFRWKLSGKYDWLAYCQSM